MSDEQDKGTVAWRQAAMTGDTTGPAGSSVSALLHVVNGDSTAHGLHKAGVNGTVSVWAEPLHEGPILSGTAPSEKWRRARAGFYQECGFGTFEENLNRLTRWDEPISACAQWDEVVLWFEHDLFDQLLLVRLLDRLAGRDFGAMRLSLISIDRYPGIERFVGLGQLTPEQLGPLFETRQPVSNGQLALAQAAWKSFCGPDPRKIEALIAAGTSDLPFLAGALARHLEQFPSVRNGLSRTENQALESLAAGPRRAVDLFRVVQDMEERPFMGDTIFWLTLKRMADGPDPVVALESKRPDAPFAELRVTLSETGERVLHGLADWLAIGGSGRWLGGLHIQGNDSPWRWDEASRRLVANWRS